MYSCDFSPEVNQLLKDRPKRILRIGAILYIVVVSIILIFTSAIRIPETIYGTYDVLPVTRDDKMNYTLRDHTGLLQKETVGSSGTTENDSLKIFPLLNGELVLSIRISKEAAKFITMNNDYEIFVSASISKMTEFQTKVIYTAPDINSDSVLVRIPIADKARKRWTKLALQKSRSKIEINVHGISILNNLINRLTFS